MKMHLILSCLSIVSALLHCALAASAANVGLYAPDRYSGIPERCLMPMDFGYCRAKVKRYYFDMRRMKCAMFYFGGCAGNVNNFKSLEECNSVCLDGYGDYDSPNDVVATNSKATSGRDYRIRGSTKNTIDNNNKNAISAGSGRAGSSSSSSNTNNSGSGGNDIKITTTPPTSYGGSIANAGYKNIHNKYNTNSYHTNAATSAIASVNNGGGGGAGSSNNNTTKILRSRADENVDEYEYEEEN